MNVIPVTLLTGFLGSGKTTILNQLLRHPELGETAVLVNEIGTIGIDHDLVIGGSDDMLLLDGGCLCCQPRGSVAEALMRLAEPESGGARKSPMRVIIETSGAANPLPVLETLALTPSLRKRFHFSGIITVVDALFGSDTLASHHEARLQLAGADCIVISKTDLLHEKRAPDRLMHDLDRHNTSAIRCTSAPDRVPEIPVRLLAESILRKMPAPIAVESVHRSTGSAHNGDTFDTVALAFPGMLAPETAEAWVSNLLETYGNHLLRVKGLLSLSGYAQQAILQCVRDVVYPMRHAETRTDQAKNRVVLISRDIHTELLREQLETLAAQAVPLRHESSLSALGGHGHHRLRRS